MSRSLRRGALAAVLAVTIVPLAAACGAGSEPQTLEVKPDSVATTVGDVEIQSAYILTRPGDTAGPASISARVFNNSASPQRLTSIIVQGLRGRVTLSDNGRPGPITIPGNGAVTLGGAGNPSASLASGAGLTNGSFHNTVFAFSGSGQVAVAPSVVPADQYFASFGPTAPATPGAHGTASATTGGVAVRHTAVQHKPLSPAGTKA